MFALTVPRFNNTEGVSCDKARGLERVAAYLSQYKDPTTIVHAIKVYGTSAASGGMIWEDIEVSHHYHAGMLLGPAIAAIGGVPIMALIRDATGGLRIYTVDMDRVKASVHASATELYGKVQQFLND